VKKFNIILLLISIIAGTIVVGLMALLIFIAYRADVEGISVGAPDITIEDAENNAKLDKQHECEDSGNVFYPQDEYSYIGKGSGASQGTSEKSEHGTRSVRDMKTDASSLKGSGHEGPPISASKYIAPEPKRQASPEQFIREGMSEGQSIEWGPIYGNKYDVPQIGLTDDLFYGFGLLKDGFLPSTLGRIDIKRIAMDKRSGTPKSVNIETNVLVKLSGSVARELLVFGAFNSMENGKLLLEGKFKLIPQGRNTNDSLDLTFKYFSTQGNTYMALPIPLNGQIRSKIMPVSGMSIDKHGGLNAINPVTEPIDITYTIVRKNKNSRLSVKQPISRWMNKEFEHIPEDIKGFLDKSKNGPRDYRLIHVYTVLNRCFGYQKDIFPAKLPRGSTWSSYFGRSIENNTRLLADCDVLSTYAFIFTRYLGLESAIVVGYNNVSPENLDTLTSDEHHAALYVNSDNGWVVFDPSEAVPDMSHQAMLLSMKEEDYRTFLDRESMIDTRVGAENMPLMTNKRYSDNISVTGQSAQKFTIPDKVMSILGDDLFQSTGSERARNIHSPKMDFTTSLDMDDILTLYKNRPIMIIWSPMIIFIGIGLMLSSMGIMCSLRILPGRIEGLNNMIRAIALFPFITGKFSFFTCLYFAVQQARGIQLNVWQTTGWGMFIGTVLIITASLLNIAALFSNIRNVRSNKGLWVEGGIYAITRNPEVISYFLAGAGACFYAPGPLIIFLCLVSIYTHHGIVRKREKYIFDEAKEKWIEYSKDVPRYI